MNLIPVIVTLAVIGLLWWMVTTYLPLPDPMKKIITVVIVFGTVLWLLNVFGLLGAANIPIGHVGHS